MNAWHAPDDLLDRYVASAEPELLAATAWSVEAHLDGCASCRARLAARAARQPELDALLVEVDARLIGLLDAEPPRRGASSSLRAALLRRGSWLPAGRTLPWLCASLLVLLAALAADLGAGASEPGLVLVVAPVLPLIGVGASWGRLTDPMHELMATVPVAGLALVLRRTFVVLVIVLPVAALAGELTGASPARWLLPALALTTGSLALGTRLGVTAATFSVGVAWCVAVVVPAFANATDPGVLQASWLPVWAAVSIASAGLLAARRSTYDRLLPT